MSVALRWWWVLSLAACNGANGHASKDASAGGDAPRDGASDGGFDASFDAPWDAAADGPHTCSGCGSITVTVYGDGTVGQLGATVAGIDVWFVWPDLTTSKVTTDSSGVAIGTGPDGTDVMVVRQEATQHWSLSAYEGVLAGDALTDGYSAPAASTTTAANVSVSYPAVGGTNHYQLRASCMSSTANGSTTTQVIAPVVCSESGSATIAALALDASNNPLGYSVATGIDYSAHDGAGNGVTLPAFQALPSVTVTFTNLAAQDSLFANVRYTLGSDPTLLAYAQGTNGGTSATQAATATIVPAGDHTSIDAYITFSGITVNSVNVVRKLASRVSATTIDTSNMVHPAWNGHYDYPSDSVVWTESAVGLDATTVTGYMTWTTPSSNQVHLSFMGPRGATTSLRAPRFPAALTQLAYIPDQVAGGLTLSSYVGKTYHDVLVGQTSGADMWWTTP